MALIMPVHTFWSLDIGEGNDLIAYCKGMKEDRIRQGWRDWLASNHRGWRLFVGFVCFIGLALFLHFREVRIETLELNATASRYIVAQIDFEFPDYETMIVLKQQAMQDIGQVYQIDDKQIREARYQLEDFLIHSKEWRREAPTTTFEEMYKAADEIETLLLEARFPDPRTIQVIKSLNLPDASYFEFVPDENGTNLPDDFWNWPAEQIAKGDGSQARAVAYILNTFKKRRWALTPDIALEHSLRAQVSRTVPEKYTKVQDT